MIREVSLQNNMMSQCRWPWQTLDNCVIITSKLLYAVMVRLLHGYEHVVDKLKQISPPKLKPSSSRSGLKWKTISCPLKWQRWTLWYVRKTDNVGGCCGLWNGLGENNRRHKIKHLTYKSVINLTAKWIMDCLVWGFLMVIWGKSILTLI